MPPFFRQAADLFCQELLAHIFCLDSNTHSAHLMITFISACHNLHLKLSAEVFEILFQIRLVNTVELFFCYIIIWSNLVLSYLLFMSITFCVLTLVFKYKLVFFFLLYIWCSCSSFACHVRLDTIRQCVCVCEDSLPDIRPICSVWHLPSSKSLFYSSMCLLVSTGWR